MASRILKKIGPPKLETGVERKSTFIDMTPLVDLAFLLITFFMLTINFVKDVQVEVEVPMTMNERDAVKDTIREDDKLLIISVTEDGKAYFNMHEDKDDRAKVFIRLNEVMDLGLNSRDIEMLGYIEGIGVEFSKLKQLASLPNAQVTDYQKQYAKGIPIDSVENNPPELTQWVTSTREVVPGIFIIMEADAQTPYPTVKKVFDAIQNSRGKPSRLKLMVQVDGDELQDL